MDRAQSLPMKLIRSPKKKSFAPKTDNFATSDVYDGILRLPQPTLSSSYPPSSFFKPNHHFQPNPQPPLLPLPNPTFRSQSRGISCPRRNRDHSLTPKKPNPTKRNHQQVMKKDLDLKSTVQSMSVFLGPDLKDLPPKEGSAVLSCLTTESVGRNRKFCTVVDHVNDFETFSGSVSFLSPPPSCLPLPKFSLRPKLSCNAEAAAGVDDGATDNLRRLLRLP